MTRIDDFNVAPGSAPSRSIGVIELSSIAVGYRVQDDMLKAAKVELLVARTICSGKYMVIFTGSVTDVRAAIEEGLRTSGEAVIDHLVIPHVHESVLPALGQSVVLEPAQAQALGVVESYSGTSIIAAADAAAKAARVTLFRVHVAMAVGGKGFLLLTGEQSAVASAVAAAAAEVRQRGLLVGEVVIPRPSRELFGEYI